MNERPFRFGVSLLQGGSTPLWATRVRQVEDLGYDVLQVPDHLGMVAPFPALAAAAEVSPNLTVGTYVLNGGVLSPGYLARDAAELWRLSGGRFELGLGAGYVEAEFEAAGVPFGTPGDRLRKLTSLITETRVLLAAQADKPRPPIMVAGVGDRILTMAAAHADIISFPIHAGFGPGLGRRVSVVRAAAGGRDIELNLFVAAVGDTIDEVDLSMISKASGMTAQQLAEMPGVLAGSPAELAERLLRYREEWGLSYISVLEPHMAAFAAVIPLLR
ncbi:TIGR03621 family F420-dependent LLM class oxidoreductase [Actinoplanes sp. NPDC049596]|uniref:TIGR03621 family F420-dependent LLM class oxidoreductase n=1 Tax=unclassified Actinoplanes TaxID=2626549 RepID=UPI003422E0AD